MLSYELEMEFDTRMTPKDSNIADCNNFSSVENKLLAKGGSRDFEKGGALCRPPWLAGEKKC